MQVYFEKLKVMVVPCRYVEWMQCISS